MKVFTLIGGVNVARHGSRHAGEPKILSCSFRLPRKNAAKGSIA